MQGHLKTAGLVALVAVTVLGAGYLWGARGRWAAEERLAIVERQAVVGETRGLVLAGQLALTRLNFGEASGLFESARVSADRAARRLDADGMLPLAGESTKAAEALGEARGLAAKLDQAAAGKASDALAALDRVVTGLANPVR